MNSVWQVPKSPPQIQVSPNLVVSLKRTIQDLQMEIEAKDEELDFIKKKMKYTKI